MRCFQSEPRQMFYFFSHHFELLKSAYLLAQDVEQRLELHSEKPNIREHRWKYHWSWIYIYIYICVLCVKPRFQGHLGLI